MKIFFKLIHDKQGGHYHCAVFSAKQVDGTFAKLGDLCLDENDFNALESKNFEIILQPKGFLGSHKVKEVFAGMLNDSPIAKTIIESIEANSSVPEDLPQDNPPKDETFRIDSGDFLKAGEAHINRCLQEDFEFFDKHSE
jgi:hypothetical protein